MASNAPEPARRRGRPQIVQYIRTIETIYPSAEAAIKALKDEQYIMGHAVSKSHTKKKGDRLERIDMVCSRSGTYRPRASNKGKNKTSSRKCGCPCQWIIKPSSSAGYIIQVVAEQHNHEGTHFAQASAPVRRHSQCRFDPKLLRDRVMSLSESGALTSNQIAMQLQRDFPGLLIQGSDVRHIRKGARHEQYAQQTAT